MSRTTPTYGSFPLSPEVPASARADKTARLWNSEGGQEIGCRTGIFGSSSAS